MAALKVKDITAIKTKDIATGGLKTSADIKVKSLKYIAKTAEDSKESEEKYDSTQIEHYVKKQGAKVNNYLSNKQVKIERKVFPKIQEKPVTTKTAFSPLKSRRELHGVTTKEATKETIDKTKDMFTAPIKRTVMKNKTISKAVRNSKNAVGSLAKKKSVQAATKFARAATTSIKMITSSIASMFSFVAALGAVVIVIAVVMVFGMFSSETASEGMFISPYGEEPYTITYAYGEREDPITGLEDFHDGWDVVAASGEGTPLYAVYDGKIIKAVRSEEGFGNHVTLKVDTEEDMIVIYGHLQDFIVVEGMEVVQGQLIGFEGNTGRSSGSHLHYEVRIDGEPVNGMYFWKLIPGALNADSFGN